MTPEPRWQPGPDGDYWARWELVGESFGAGCGDVVPDFPPELCEDFPALPWVSRRSGR